MLFAVANIEVNPVILVCVAFVISLFCSTAGISGAFLLLPYQLSILGYTAPGVSATNQIFNILACPSGVIRYAKEGRFLWPLALIIAAGTLPGVFIGAIIRIKFLNKPHEFLLFAAFVLLYLSLRMLKSLFKQSGNSNTHKVVNKCKILVFNWKNFSFIFQDKVFNVSNGGLFLISGVVGLLGGIYGVGGGAIISPILVSIYGLPIHALSGACLFATFLTSIFGVMFFTFFSFVWGYAQAAPDWLLGLFLGLGGVCGMYFGAAIQKYLPPIILKIFLILILLFVSFQYFWQWLA